MQFFKDGDHLKIVAERMHGGFEEVYLTKEKASQVVSFIMQNATARKEFMIIP